MEKDDRLEPIDGKEILRELPLTGIRRMIAAKMEESLRKSPQATITAKADMSGLAALKEEYAKRGIELTYTDLFVKAAETALKLNPALNASLQNGRIVQYKSVNIGVAVGTEKGLFVPVIRNVQDKSLQEVAQELKGLIQKIKEGKIAADDFAGGTFTVSNMGMFRVDVMTPIINVPEAAILSIGAVRREPVADDDDSIKIKPMATLSLTIDHAVLDGLPAARFLESFLEAAEDPFKFFS